MAIKYTEINTEDIICAQLQEYAFIPSQRISWINKSDKSKLLIQTPKMVSEAYGIPREGNYFTTDKSRSFYKLAFSHERKQYADEVDYNEIEEFYKKMKEVDAYFASTEFKKKLFGDKNLNKYEYQPIVREDEQEEDNQLYRPPYIKLKIDLNFATNCPVINLYNKEDGVRKLVTVEKLDDITEHLKYLTKARFIINIDRLYLMKIQNGDKKKYGICIKIVAAECENTIKKPLERTDTSFVDFTD